MAMQTQRGLVKYKDRSDIVCTYGVTDSGVQYYFLNDSKLANNNIIVTTTLLEAVDPIAIASHVGIIDSEGNVVVPCENKAIKLITSDIVLVEKAVPTSENVLESLRLREDPLAATKLVTTPATIKDNMNRMMGSEGRFIFNDQFSEASIFDISGRNLVNNEYYSFIGINNEKIYLCKNQMDSQILEYSLYPVENDKTETVDSNLDVQATEVTREVIEQAINDQLANVSVESEEIPSESINSMESDVQTNEDITSSGEDIVNQENVVDNNFESVEYTENTVVPNQEISPIAPIAPVQDEVEVSQSLESESNSEEIEETNIFSDVNVDSIAPVANTEETTEESLPYNLADALGIDDDEDSEDKNESIDNNSENEEKVEDIPETEPVEEEVSEMSATSVENEESAESQDNINEVVESNESAIEENTENVESKEDVELDIAEDEEKSETTESQEDTKQNESEDNESIEDTQSVNPIESMEENPETAESEEDIKLNITIDEEKQEENLENDDVESENTPVDEVKQEEIPVEDDYQEEEENDTIYTERVYEENSPKYVKDSFNYDYDDMGYNNYLESYDYGSNVSSNLPQKNIFDDVTVTISNLVELNRNLQGMVEEYDSRLAKCNASRKKLVELSKSQAREISSLNARIGRLEGEKQILENKLATLTPSSNGELARVMSDAKSILGSTRIRRNNNIEM